MTAFPLSVSTYPRTLDSLRFISHPIRCSAGVTNLGMRPINTVSVGLVMNIIFPPQPPKKQMIGLFETSGFVTGMVFSCRLVDDVVLLHCYVEEDDQVRYPLLVRSLKSQQKRVKRERKKWQRRRRLCLENGQPFSIRQEEYKKRQTLSLSIVDAKTLNARPLRCLLCIIFPRLQGLAPLPFRLILLGFEMEIRQVTFTFSQLSDLDAHLQVPPSLS